jgi:DNA primase
LAGRILRADIDALRERADIVDVVSDHTQLKRAGARFKGLCPFHQERTPSFTVDPANNLYYCFGCGAGGDVFGFLMAVEGLDFTEAVEHLARRNGYTLRYEELSAGQRAALGARTRLLAINQHALEFFRAQLYGDEGTIARDYLKERGFGRDDADRFALGYAPNSWDALSRHLEVEQRVARRDIVEVGLAQDNNRGGLRDRFRGRLIFPVRDASGDVIGFGGRILPGIDYGDFDPPKYYNSPESPLYKKTRVLYGLSEARADIVRAGEALVCEGYTDVMALHQAGYGNAVATCGTAVGAEHLRILSRYAERVVLAFDSDAAGAKAAERAWEEARKLDTEAGGEARTDLRVLVLPAGVDPADHVRSAGVDGMRAAVDAATAVVPFLIRHRIEAADTTSEAGRVAALRDALAVLADEVDLDLRRTWARTEIGDRLGLSDAFVRQTAGRLGVELDREEGIAELRPDDRARRGRVLTQGVAQRRARRERAVLRAALQDPDLLPDEWFELDADAFTHPRARVLFETLMAAGGAGVALDAVLDHAADDDVRRLIHEVSLEEPEFSLGREEAEQVTVEEVRKLLADALDDRMDDLKEQLVTVNVRTDADRARELMVAVQALEARTRELRQVDPV